MEQLRLIAARTFTAIEGFLETIFFETCWYDSNLEDVIKVFCEAAVPEPGEHSRSNPLPVSPVPVVDFHSRMEAYSSDADWR